MSHRPAVLVLALVLSGATEAFPQTTRAEELEQRRAAKSTELRAYEPGRLEKILLYLEQTDPLGRIAPRNGFFVRYGYYEKPVGSGIGVGAGYRHDLFARRARVVAEGGVTLRNYQLLRADLSLPYLAHERVEVGVEATRRRHPQEDFYGIGLESRRADRVSYRLDTNALVGRALVRPRPWLVAGVHVGRLAPTIGPGTDVRFPPIGARFDAGDAPGLSEQPDFGYTDLFTAVDYRDQPGNARAGGYYAASFARYADLGGNRYGFRRFDLRVQQFVPVFDKKRVFAVQGRVITSTAGDGRTVPFYFQPTLGGSSTLRSVADYRFRDANLLHLNAEYRWEAFSGLDMALFSDFGKVSARAGDLDLSGLKRAYGVGLRFNTYKSVFLRVDVGAGGGEGTRLFFKFSNVF